LYPNYEIFPKDNDFEKSSLKAKKKRRPVFYQRVSMAEKVRQEKERYIEFSIFQVLSPMKTKEPRESYVIIHLMHHTLFDYLAPLMALLHHTKFNLLQSLWFI
jgi:hypothetical protein